MFSSNNAGIPLKYLWVYGEFELNSAVGELRWPPTSIPTPFTKTTVDSNPPLAKYTSNWRIFARRAKMRQGCSARRAGHPPVPSLDFFKKIYYN